MTKYNDVDFDKLEYLCQVEGYNDTQLIEFLGISRPTFYKWKNKYGGLELSDIKRLKHLEHENSRLKQMVADLMLDNKALKAISEKNW